MLLVCFVGYPLVRLTVDSFSSGGLDSYRIVLESSAARHALVTTVLVAIAVALAAVAIGGLLAWYARTARSGWARAAIWVGLLAPFFMGTVTRNYALVLLFADNGPLNDALRALGLGPAPLLYSSTGVALGILYTMIPPAAFALYGVLLTIDDTLIAAARGLGASRLRAALTITLPLALPGLVAAFALVFAVSLGFYITPVLIGGAQAPFVASLIQEWVFASYDLPLAYAASVLLLVVALAIVGLALLLVGRRRLLRTAA
ncbi:MAG TPA: ABC transporter permease subunit [Thermoleophilaceae bacterium]|nr:ABC transporter permease subunit [Thermoleophilaceae bacterium]